MRVLERLQILDFVGIPSAIFYHPFNHHEFCGLMLSTDMTFLSIFCNTLVTYRYLRYNIVDF